MNTTLPPLRADIHPNDEMLKVARQTFQRESAARVEYFRQGSQIHETISQIAHWRFHEMSQISKYLEFACGFGRSTRFLVRELAASKIWVSDIYSDAVDFQKETFGVHGIVSKTDPDQLVCETGYDFIFVASLFTHLPPPRFEAWLKRLFSLLSAKGVLAFSVHDQALAPSEKIPASGILFRAESESGSLDKAEYGTNITTEAYVKSAIEKATKMEWKYHRLPHALCGAHDVYLVSKDADIDYSSLAYFSPLMGYCEGIISHGEGVFEVSGWAGNPNAGLDVAMVQIYVNHCLVASVKPELLRSDVASVLSRPEFSNSGWRTSFTSSGADQGPSLIEVFAISQSGAGTLLHLGPLMSFAM